ncbi:MAG: ParB/RepB/Spo0J family partition protein [Pseudomonadota bacterium]
MGKQYITKSDALGRGLAELLGEKIEPLKSSKSPEPLISTVSWSLLHANINQPRKRFSEDELKEFAQSLSANGMLQPIIVRHSTTHRGKYEIIAGERRWRAANIAKLEEVPVIIKDVDDRLGFEIALVENIQRVDLNPLEEATGYHQLMTKYHYTQERLSQMIGKSRSHIANMVRLLDLPQPIQDQLNESKISASHARCLVGHKDAIKLANRVIDESMSVRQLEKLVSKDKNPSKKPKKILSIEDDNELKALEKSISEIVNLDVKVNGLSKGHVKIYFSAFHELEGLLDHLTRGHDTK